ncbi:MAG: nucleotide-binding universal stress UspA family protein [Desulforhopalus sp.]|jgi:nucleotide-binding universal stress UspA family protein
MKIDNILLPFDGSEHSINAAKYALGLVKLTGGHVTILYCDDWNMYGSEVPETLLEQMRSNRKDEARVLLKRAEGIFENQGTKYTLEVVTGSPAQVLTLRAQSKEYDLIIMGSHGHSDIAGLFLGSVTHKVLNKIHCPVLIVP